MIRRKPLFALTVLAGVIVSTGVAYGATMMMGNTHSTASHSAVDLAEVAAKQAAPIYLEADLSGRGEMMRSSNKYGDPNGQAMVVLRITRNQIMYEITWQGMSTPSTVRLQEGVAGLAGPVDMNLMPSAMPSSINAIAGVISLRGTGLLNLLLSRPSSYYANLSTSSFPSGAVRGQFRQIGPFDFNRILHIGAMLSSENSGDQEVTQAHLTMGAANAHATVFLSARGNALSYAAIWSGVPSPTALNINKGAIGNNGNPVVTLFRVPRGLNPTIIAVAGTVMVPMNTINVMKANPAAFHTNLLSGRFPGGAVRGQVFALGTFMTTTTTTMPTMTMPTTTRPTMTTMPTMPTMTNPTMTNTNTAPMTTSQGPITHW